MDFRWRASDAAFALARSASEVAYASAAIKCTIAATCLLAPEYPARADSASEIVAVGVPRFLGVATAAHPVGAEVAKCLCPGVIPEDGHGADSVVDGRDATDCHVRGRARSRSRSALRQPSRCYAKMRDMGARTFTAPPCTSRTGAARARRSPSGSGQHWRNSSNSDCRLRAATPGPQVTGCDRHRPPRVFAPGIRRRSLLRIPRCRRGRFPGPLVPGSFRRESGDIGWTCWRGR